MPGREVRARGRRAAGRERSLAGWAHGAPCRTGEASCPCGLGGRTGPQCPRDPHAVGRLARVPSGAVPAGRSPTRASPARNRTRSSVGRSVGRAQTGVPAPQARHLSGQLLITRPDTARLSPRARPVGDPQGAPQTVPGAGGWADPWHPSSGTAPPAPHSGLPGRRPHPPGRLAGCIRHRGHSGSTPTATPPHPLEPPRLRARLGDKRGGGAAGTTRVRGRGGGTPARWRLG